MNNKNDIIGNNIGIERLYLLVMSQTMKELNNDNLVKIYEYLEDEEDKTATVDELEESLDISRRTINRQVNDSKILERVGNKTNFSPHPSLVRLKGHTVTERAVLLSLACNRQLKANGVPVEREV